MNGRLAKSCTAVLMGVLLVSPMNVSFASSCDIHTPEITSKLKEWSSEQKELEQGLESLKVKDQSKGEINNEKKEPKRKSKKNTIKTDTQTSVSKPKVSKKVSKRKYETPVKRKKHQTSRVFKTKNSNDEKYLQIRSDVNDLKSSNKALKKDVKTLDEKVKKLDGKIDTALDKKAVDSGNKDAKESVKENVKADVKDNSNSEKSNITNVDSSDKSNVKKDKSKARKKLSFLVTLIAFATSILVGSTYFTIKKYE